MNQLDLNQRIAVITGGAQGMGYATAQRMLASGAAVALWDIDAQRLAQARETLKPAGKVITAVVELTDEASVEAATQATLAAFGRIDILVDRKSVV